MLSKRLDLQIDTIQLTALSLAYQRAKDAETEIANNAMHAADEVAKQIEDDDENDDEPMVPVVAATPSLFPEEELSPLLKQFLELKAKHPDALLLFRCGDFYETYREDAEDASKILGITLTVREKDHEKMAGFPHHALDTYLPKLIRAGRRVAICDKIEDSASKKLVKRGVKELVSANNVNEGAYSPE